MKAGTENHFFNRISTDKHGDGTIVLRECFSRAKMQSNTISSGLQAEVKFPRDSISNQSTKNTQEQLCGHYVNVQQGCN